MTLFINKVKYFDSLYINYTNFFQKLLFKAFKECLKNTC